MTFDEVRRRNSPPEGPLIPSADSQAAASFFGEPAVDDSAVEDLNETEMKRFLQWLEGTLLIDELGGGRV